MYNKYGAINELGKKIQSWILHGHWQNGAEPFTIKVFVFLILLQ